MAIQFVGGNIAGKVGATSGNTTIALNSGLTGGIASSVAADDLVIAVFATASVADRTLSITSDYTLIDSELYIVGGTYDTNLRVMYKFMPSTPDTTTTFGPTTNANDAGAMAVYVFRGVDKTTPLDVAAIPASAGNTSRVNPAAIEPVTSGAYIVCVGAAAHAGGVDTFGATDLVDFLTIGANDSNDISLGIGHKDDWTSGSFDPAVWTHTQSDATTLSYAAMTIALRPAAGGSVATSAGTSTASATGASNKSASASSAGVATASAVGVAQYLTVGTSAGTATAAATGAADFRSVGTSAGLSDVSGIGAAQALSVASAAGTSTAEAVGDEEGGAEAVATATAGATVSGVGAAQFAAVGTSSGSAAVSGVTLVNFAAVGLSQGIAAANAVGAVQALSVFSAAGLATVNGVSFTDEPEDTGIAIFLRRRRR